MLRGMTIKAREYFINLINKVQKGRAKIAVLMCKENDADKVVGRNGEAEIQIGWVCAERVCG